MQVLGKETLLKYTYILFLTSYTDSDTYSCLRNFSYIILPGSKWELNFITREEALLLGEEIRTEEANSCRPEYLHDCLPIYLLNSTEEP